MQNLTTAGEESKTRPSAARTRNVFIGCFLSRSCFASESDKRTLDGESPQRASGLLAASSHLHMNATRLPRPPHMPPPPPPPPQHHLHPPPSGDPLTAAIRRRLAALNNNDSHQGRSAGETCQEGEEGEEDEEQGEGEQEQKEEQEQEQEEEHFTPTTRFFSVRPPHGGV